MSAATGPGNSQDQAHVRGGVSDNSGADNHHGRENTREESGAGAEGANGHGDGSRADGGSAKANGEDTDGPFDDPFDDDSRQAEADAEEAKWRVDLPTKDEVKLKPSSVYAPKKLTALVRLREANLEEFIDLVESLVTAATNAGVTRAKLLDAVQKHARKLKQEEQERGEGSEADEAVAVQVLKWLDTRIATYFVDDYRRPFIDYRDPGSGVFTCRPVLHDDVKDLINTCPIMKVAPPDAVVSAVIRTMETRARRSRNMRKVFVRRGWHERVLYIDRAAADGSVIRVQATGWDVVPLDQCPVRFQFDISMGELPVPRPGGTVCALWKFVRVQRAQDQHVVSGFVIGYYAPHGPFSGLGAYGQYGSAKSMMLELITSLTDPSKVSPGKMSNSEENTLIHAQRAAILPYDNLTGLSDDQANTLCRVVQGAGFRTRLLYSNSGEAILNAELPVIANGITQFVVRPDLADRFTTVTLERIPDDQRRTRQEIRDAFEQVRPELLGAFLSAIAGGLARTDYGAPNKLPRLADHAVWVSLCERGLGMADGDYLRALEASARTAARDAVGADFLGVTIVEMQEARAGERWTNTPEKTYAEITGRATDKARRSKEWPPNAVWLTRRLRPLVPLLAKLGIEVTLDARIDTAEAENRRGILIEGRAADPEEGADAGTAASAAGNANDCTSTRAQGTENANNGTPEPDENAVKGGSGSRKVRRAF
jgi:hypothetical protein